MREHIEVESGLTVEELNEIAQIPAQEDEQEPVFASINPEDWSELVVEAKLVVELGEKNMWAKADIANEAATQYGKLKELCEEINESYGYWRILSHVAKQFPKEVREQFPELSFRHFQTVASLENRLDLLRQANEQRLSVSKMMLLNIPARPEVIKPVKIESDNVEATDEPQLPGNLYSKYGIKVKQAIELLNYINSLDKDVAKSVAESRRPCQVPLEDFLKESFNKELSGIGVLDMFNLMFLGQGRIVYDSSLEEPFTLTI